MNSQKYYPILPILLTFTVLSACGSHLTSEQCTTMNWNKMGMQDGQIGQSKRSLIKEIDDCAKYNIDVDVENYNRGYEAGVRGYCQPTNAYQLGVQGKYYNPVCPSDLQPAFESKWREGLRLYCVPQTAFNLGRQGLGMPDFCALDQLNAFRNNYQRGFQIYQRVSNIELQIGTLSAENDRINQKLRNNQTEIERIQSQLNRPVSPVTGERLTPIVLRDLDARRRILQDQNDDMQRIRDRNTAQISRLQLQMNAH